MDRSLIIETCVELGEVQVVIRDLQNLVGSLQTDRGWHGVFVAVIDLGSKVGQHLELFMQMRKHVVRVLVAEWTIGSFERHPLGQLITGNSAKQLFDGCPQGKS